MFIYCNIDVSINPSIYIFLCFPIDAQAEFGQGLPTLRGHWEDANGHAIDLTSGSWVFEVILASQMVVI